MSSRVWWMLGLERQEALTHLRTTGERLAPGRRPARLPLTCQVPA
jgi:hypothetical protein